MSQSRVAGVPRLQCPKGSTLELRSQHMGWGSRLLLPADFSEAAWKLELLNTARGTLSDVEGYDEETLDLNVILFAPRPWRRDSVGYNFAHTPPNRESAPFDQLRRIYRVTYTLRPANPQLQDLILPFEIEVI